MINLELPEKGFTKAEREWLNQLIEAIKTVEAVPGRNVQITTGQNAQIISANDCEPCP